MTDVPVHEDLEPLAFLLGSWEGKGTGKYPTIASFEYRERVEFTHDGRPFLFYVQKTWRSDNDMPSHSEIGFWRPKPDRQVEIVLAHSNGVIEIQTGSYEGTRIETLSAYLASAPTAKKIEGLGRTIRVDGDELHYEMTMEFGTHEMQNHLTATLRRSD